MHTPTYVFQNGFGIYYFRMAIPKHLKTALGKREIRRSLKTTSYGLAVKKARFLAVLSDELFQAGINDKQDLDTALRHGTTHFFRESNQVSDKCGYREKQPVISHRPVTTLTKKPIQKHLKIKGLIDQYVQCQETENSWQPKTKNENLAIFNVLVEIVGDIPLSDLSHQSADSFRTTLKMLPPNMNKSPKWKGLTIDQILKAKPPVTLSDTTINKYMRRVASLFNFAEEREYISRNYFRKKPIQEDKKANQKRDMLTSDDIAALFSPDLFKTESHKPHRRWSALIALYTSARQGEIGQLNGRDIKQVHGIWCFRFITSKQKKYTERLVPVHSNLISLGLIKYAQNCPGKLFPELNDGRDGYGQAISKWYNRYRRKCGLTQTRNKDFHALRHTAITELYRAGVDSILISEIAGHVTGNGKRRTTTEEVYIKSNDVQVLKSAIEKLDYGAALSRVTPYM